MTLTFGRSPGVFCWRGELYNVTVSANFTVFTGVLDRCSACAPSRGFEVSRSHPRSSKKYNKVKLLITAMKAQRTVEDWARGVDGTSTWDAPPPLRCNGAANTYKAHAKSKVIARE